METIVILDGLARSGTTFTSAVLNSLPETYIFSETFKFPNYYQEMHGIFGHPYNLSYFAKMDVTDFAKPIPSFNSFFEHCVKPTISHIGDFQKERIIEELLREKANRKCFISYIDAFELFYETIGEFFDARIVGGKTTYCYAFRNQMLACIPKLKWIDIVRDIRGAMLSGIVTGHYNFRSIHRDSHWEDQVATIKKYNYHHDRHLLIKYEDLLMNKEETINKIVDFLGIEHFSYGDWANKPILKNDGSLFGTHSSFDEEGRPTIGRIEFRSERAFDATPLKRWEQNFSSSEKWFLTTWYKKHLNFLGYPVQKYFPVNLKMILDFGINKFYRILGNILYIIKKKQKPLSI